MKRWCKRWSLLAGGLLGIGSLASPALAQAPFTPPMPTPTFGSEPQAPQAPDFPNAAPGDGPDFPNPGKKLPYSPFSLNDDLEPSAFDDDDRCRPADPYTFILRGEYLNWRVRDGHLPIPLATTGTAPEFGALNQASTRILFGQGDYEYGDIRGGRVTLGLAVGCLPPVETSGFFLNRDRTLFSANSGGAVLSRPLILANVPGPDGVPLPSAVKIGFPGAVAGNMQTQATFNLWGIESNFVCNLGRSDVLSVDVLLGYRYAELGESLSITNSMTALSATGLPFAGGFAKVGDGVRTIDIFTTRNQFNGGQLGVRGTLCCWRFNVMLDAKLALGDMHEELRIDGFSTLYPKSLLGRQSRTVQGGVLALASNSGQFSRSAFVVIPEFGVQVGFQLTQNIRLVAGGTAFGMSSVTRPGDALTNTVNSPLVPTLSQPGQPFDPTLRTGPPSGRINSTDFWGYGYTLGLEIAF